MGKFAIIRHGPTEWNEQGRLQGQSDIPLSNSGRAKVKEWRLPVTYHKWNWFSSPMCRAQETARLLGLNPKSAPEVVEMHWGDWEGKTREEIEKEFGKEFRERLRHGIDLRPKNGETPREVRSRFKYWITHISQKHEPFGVVAHQGIIRAALSLATGWEMVGKPPFEMDWESVHIFSINSKNRIEIENLNISLKIA